MSRALLVLIAGFLAAVPGFAQTRADAPGVIDGFVTTQGRTIPLGGAQVVIHNALNDQVASVVAEGDGHFRVIALPDGRYRVAAMLAGFERTETSATVTAGATTDVRLDLAIAPISQTVEVVGSASSVSSGPTIAGSDAIGGRELEQFTGGGFSAALRLLASIIEVPGGLSIKGGRPSQASVQIGPSTLVDPSTGLTAVALPDDAIDSIAVLPNPYAVEYGRFSSGLVVIQTRRAGDQWKTRINNLDPTFRTTRGTMFNIRGIAAFAPRLETGGPIVKDKLFIEQTAQFRYGTSDVPSRSEDELKTTMWFSSFTRVDANVSPRHSLVATGGVFPSVAKWATLGTFTPPDATADIHSQVNHVGATERAIWTDTLFSETTGQIHESENDVLPQGKLPMELLPETTLGNFYNTQHRSTATYQLVETVSGTRNIGGGLHLFKAGFDLLYSRYHGTSASQPVLVERTDGSLARRLDFAGPTSQAVDSTDLALFVQDRFQPNTRWYLEFGGRLDHDGIVDRLNVTPRIGTAVLLTENGGTVLRGGFGLFYERTPSTVGAFEQFESATDTRYAGDGLTRIGPPVPLRHVVAPDLDTPRSRTWDIGFDHRINEQWSLRGGLIDRTGDSELVVQPLREGPVGTLLVSSTGRSKFRELELTVHFTHGPAFDATATYAHATARGDLNSLNNYYDAVMWPIVGENAYAPLPGDVPHRLLARGRAMPTPTWLFIGIIDWRSGMPWSAVNEYLDFVGPRNEQYRFPSYVRTELGIEHRFKIFKLRPWIGVRAYNAFDAFLPMDVQNNLSSPLFGTFYNSEYRQLRLQVRFER
jgi:TonB dependent receptor-like, beta-barrel/Carboxypeptidase regulatory-like domain